MSTYSCGDPSHDHDDWVRPYSHHPAYDVLVARYRGSTSAPKHLAFLALAALDNAGFLVERRES